MTRARHLLALLIATSLGLVFAAAPAVAAGGGRFFQPPSHYNDHYRFDPECPGQALDVRGHAWGVDSLRFVRGSHGQAFLQKDRYHFRERWTNTDTGRSFLVLGHGVFTERKAVFVANDDVPADLVPPEGLVGPVYLFTATDVGQPFIVKQHGRTILRDRGFLEQQYLFDTLGDSQPGGTQLSFEFTKVVGPHPGLEVDVCDLARQLTR